MGHMRHPYAGAPALSRAAWNLSRPTIPKSLNGKIHNPMTTLHKPSFPRFVVDILGNWFYFMILK